MEERSNMAHDRLRRATADASSSPLINGSLFVDAGCILMYFKGFLFKYSNATHDIFNMTGLEYSFTPNCEDDNTTDRYELIQSKQYKELHSTSLMDVHCRYFKSVCESAVN